MTATPVIDVRSPDEVGVAWQRLWQQVPEATPFASPAWLVAWARHYAPGRCWVATASAGGELVACLPVFWWQERVLLAGTGPSDHGAELFLPGFEACAGELLAAALAAIGRPVERVELEQLAPSSPLLAMPCPAGWKEQIESGAGCPVLTLRASDALAAVPKAMRRNWRYAMHAVERARGRLELVERADVNEAVIDLQRLHGLRWAERSEQGVLADPLLQRLLADAAPALAGAGMLRLHRLRVDGQSVAVLLALRGGRRTCCYLSGFDPSFARLSPVTALVGATIEQAARENDVAVDFLRGEERYKFTWGASLEPRLDRVLARA
jgi:CelD/BcsL family acetyltransferase involved in cellulose biosynthesis